MRLIGIDADPTGIGEIRVMLVVLAYIPSNMAHYGSRLALVLEMPCRIDD